MPGIDRPYTDYFVWEPVMTEKERVKKLIEVMDAILEQVRGDLCSDYAAELIRDYERIKLIEEYERLKKVEGK